MTADRLAFSMPGEWIDASGVSHPRPILRRILVLKPDHIGDLLIASQAFKLLRRFFPDACIDLICGPWNVDLARRMAIFDAVHGINFFYEVSALQTDAARAEAERRRGIAALEALQLGPYDLALDLRYDPDSRSVLPSIASAFYAGFGSLTQFPFLDVALPLPIGGTPLPRSDVLLSGRQFYLHGLASLTSEVAGGLLTPTYRIIEFRFTIEGARSPKECGTVPSDERELGIAVQSVVLEVLKPDGADHVRLAIDHDDLLFLSGWDGPEPWGTWALGRHAHLAIRVPASLREKALRATFAMRGHVNAHNSVVECAIESNELQRPLLVRFEAPVSEALAVVELGAPSRPAELVSKPFVLASGRYEGSLRLYVPTEIRSSMSVHITVRSVTSGTTLLQRIYPADILTRGLCDLPLTFLARLANESITVAVSVNDPTAFRGATIEILSLRCIETLNPGLPVAHMEEWASLLVLRVAQAFSREPPFDADPVLHALTTCEADGDGTNPVQTHVIMQRLRDWRQDGHCLVAIALGCNNPIRTWPRHYFIELARPLLELGRVRLVFVGGRADVNDALVACDALGLNVDEHSTCGLIPLDQLGAVLGLCDLFIGSNTGTTHYAGRVGVRTVGIYSGSNHPREWGPVGPNASWVTRHEPCAPCFLSDLRECRHGHVCMRDLMPSDVLSVVRPEIRAVLDQRDAAHDRQSLDGPA